MRGLLARLRGRSPTPEASPVHVPAESGGIPPSEPSPPPAIDEPEREPAEEPPGPDVADDHDEPSAEDETAPAPEASPRAAPNAPASSGARQLPSFRPVRAGQTAVAEPLSELSLTLSEAIDLVHESGGDAMELRFLRRELQRKGGEGAEPPELWGRIEQAVTGRLRRVGRLADGQPLALRRDPK